ncbi:hypothetical protein RO624_05155 [Ruminococcus bromii]|nr:MULTISPECIES: hypothetical protein [Ruminococcus]MDT4341501.1 hypothetical protein [Ruminococcus bromii]
MVDTNSMTLCFGIIYLAPTLTFIISSSFKSLYTVFLPKRSIFITSSTVTMSLYSENISFDLSNALTSLSAWIDRQKINYAFLRNDVPLANPQRKNPA